MYSKATGLCEFYLCKLCDYCTVDYNFVSWACKMGNLLKIMTVNFKD